MSLNRTNSLEIDTEVTNDFKSIDQTSTPSTASTTPFSPTFGKKLPFDERYKRDIFSILGKITHVNFDKLFKKLINLKTDKEEPENPEDPDGKKKEIVSIYEDEKIIEFLASSLVNKSFNSLTSATNISHKDMGYTNIQKMAQILFDEKNNVNMPKIYASLSKKISDNFSENEEDEKVELFQDSIIKYFEEGFEIDRIEKITSLSYLTDNDDRENEITQFKKKNYRLITFLSYLYTEGLFPYSPIVKYLSELIELDDEVQDLDELNLGIGIILFSGQKLKNDLDEKITKAKNKGKNFDKFLILEKIIDKFKNTKDNMDFRYKDRIEGLVYLYENNWEIKVKSPTKRKK